MIYLDYQATTPLAPEAFEAMVPLLRDQFANPHSAHRPGRAAAAQVEVAREHRAGLPCIEARVRVRERAHDPFGRWNRSDPHRIDARDELDAAKQRGREVVPVRGARGDRFASQRIIEALQSAQWFIE